MVIFLIIRVSGVGYRRQIVSTATADLVAAGAFAVGVGLILDTIFTTALGEVGVAFGPELSGDAGQIAAASSVPAKSFAIIVGPSRDASGRGLGGARTRSRLAFTAANPSAVEALAIICESVFQAAG